MPALPPSLRQSSFPRAPPIASLSIKMVRKNHNVMLLSSMVHPLILCPHIYIYVLTASVIMYSYVYVLYVFISFIMCLSDHIFIWIYEFHPVPQWSCPSGRLPRLPPSSSCPSTSHRYRRKKKLTSFDSLNPLEFHYNFKLIPFSGEFDLFPYFRILQRDSTSRSPLTLSFKSLQS